MAMISGGITPSKLTDFANRKPMQSFNAESHG
jgi:hypothetical protein